MADNQSKTVNDDMKTRVVFESPQDAANYLYACMRDFADFASVPFVGPGISQDENSGELIFDQAIYSDDMRVSVAVISRRAGEGVPMKAFAIQINPTPTFEALLNDPQGKLWLEKIADSQLHAVATRAMRKADNPADPAVLEMIPTLSVAASILRRCLRHSRNIGSRSRRSLVRRSNRSKRSICRSVNFGGRWRAPVTPMQCIALSRSAVHSWAPLKRSLWWRRAKERTRPFSSVGLKIATPPTLTLTQMTMANCRWTT